LLNDFNTLVNDIDFIRQHSDRFHNPDGSPPDDVALQTARQSCLEIVDRLQKSISACRKDAGVCEHFSQSPEDFINQLPILRLPHPGQQKVPRLIGLAAVKFPPPFSFGFVKNEDLVESLLEVGFYFVVDNPEVLELRPLGSAPLPNAGTIVTQSP